MAKSPYLSELQGKTVIVELINGKSLGGKLVAVDELCVKLEHLNFKAPVLVLLSSIAMVSEHKEDTT